MKSVLLDDDIHKKLTEISKARKEKGDYCRKLRDIVQSSIYKMWMKECDK